MDNNNNIDNDNVEVLDFSDTNLSNENDTTSKTEEKKIIENNDEKLESSNKKEEGKYTDVQNIGDKKDPNKVKNIKPIIVMVIVFVLLMSSVVALPYVTEYFENLKNQSNTPSINTKPKENTNNKEGEIFTSNIDVGKSLNNIKEVKSYMYDNTVDIYLKDDNNETVSIKNNNIYSFNETKYKIETNKIISDFSYESVDYYEKLDDTYYEYLHDLTTKEYTKTETSSDKFNVIYNIFPNMINYIIEDYTIDSEKQIVEKEDNHINITIKTSIDMLKNLSFETNKIQNTIDISKLTISDVLIDLYYDENENLYKIEFSIEDKNIYQDNIEGEIESIISKYTFDSFNKIEDITLPNI